MDDLLNREYVDYLNSKRPHVVKCNVIKVSSIKSDVIDNIIFDIQDKKQTIKQPPGLGSATYNNPNSKIIAVVDYECFLNNILSNDSIKALELKKCDFIVYDLGDTGFFILNELSQSSSAKNKYGDARKQLHNAAMHLTSCSQTKAFIDNYQEKIYIFSNRTNPISTPDEIADAFEIIKKYLGEPIKREFKPIEKCGFKLLETSLIDI